MIFRIALVCIIGVYMQKSLTEVPHFPPDPNIHAKVTVLGRPKSLEAAVLQITLINKGRASYINEGSFEGGVYPIIPVGGNEELCFIRINPGPIMTGGPSGSWRLFTLGPHAKTVFTVDLSRYDCGTLPPKPATIKLLICFDNASTHETVREIITQDISIKYE